MDGNQMLTTIQFSCILSTSHPQTIPTDGKHQELIMFSLDKINVQILHGSDLPTHLPATSVQPGETTIHIQTSQDWVVTGKYRDNVLHAISLNKLGQQESQA